MAWNKLCKNRELQLVGTLNGGQSFRWSYNETTMEWVGIFAKTVWKLREYEKDIEYMVVNSLLSPKEINSKNPKEKMLENTIKQYFRLDFNLDNYYNEWSKKDKLFENSCTQFYGIRMLNQEPVENLFSFICSQNNHISRISSMVEKLCAHYGEKIYEDSKRVYYAFPEVDKLAQPLVEKELRELGFGYRAKFIHKSATQILEWGGSDWFSSLKDMKYQDAKLELMKLCGIGPKVADCICLMSLNHLEAVPVDTHVYQIAAQNYLPHLRGKKSVTDKMYAEIGGHFREIFGDKAGWAHTVLFCADLKKFQGKTESKADAKSVKRKKIK